MPEAIATGRDNPEAACDCFTASLRSAARNDGIKVALRRSRFTMSYLRRMSMNTLRRAIDAGRSFRVIPWQMGVAVRLLRLLPNAVFDPLFARAPQKARKEAA